MNDHDFIRYRAGLLKKANKVADLKVQDYAHSPDRLANFKRQAERWGGTPEHILGVYLGKHLDAIQRAVTELVAFRLDEIEARISEPIEGRLVDAINYLILLGALLEERRGSIEDQSSGPKIEDRAPPIGQPNRCKVDSRYLRSPSGEIGGRASPLPLLPGPYIIDSK